MTINLSTLTGINLSVDGGANQVQVNNQGVAIKGLNTQVTSIVRTELKGMICQLQATAQLMQQTGMTEIV